MIHVLRGDILGGRRGLASGFPLVVVAAGALALWAWAFSRHCGAVHTIAALRL
jgi:hypothetical protein